MNRWWGDFIWWVISFKSKKSYKDIDRESVKEKYELIKNDFLKPFPSENKPGFHGKSLFMW